MVRDDKSLNKPKAVPRVVIMNTTSSTIKVIQMDTKRVWSWFCAYQHLVKSYFYVGSATVMFLKTGEVVWGIDDEDGCGGFDEDEWDIYDYIDSPWEPQHNGCWLEDNMRLPWGYGDLFPAQYYM